MIMSLVVLFQLFIAIPQIGGQTTGSCCSTKTVMGSGPKSGVYNLVNENHPKCSDGCLYGKTGGTEEYCFVNSYKAITSCESPSTATTTTTYSTTTKATTSTPTTTTNTTTTTTSTTALRPILEEIWERNITLFTPDTIADKGEWGDDEFCPVGAYANGYQLYVAAVCPRRCAFDDDVALMGVRLFCQDYLDSSIPAVQISSLYMDPCDFRRRGLTCDWGSVQTLDSGYFRASRYLSEYFHDHTVDTGGAGFNNETECSSGIICRNSTLASSDPMGGLNVDMMGTDDTILTGDGVTQADVPLVDGQVTTYWSNYTYCPDGKAICGIKSKVHQGEADGFSNLGQTQVLFHCCNLPVDFDE